MGIISAAADTYYTYRFIRTLVTPWNETEAYQNGIVDENGKVLKKSSQLKTTAEKSSYTLFHRLVFNLKRIMEKLPFGKYKLASFAAAMFLLKEETNLSEKQLKDIIDKLELDFDDSINESYWNVDSDDNLSPGVYSLASDIAHPLTGEMVALKGTTVIVPAMCEAVDNIFGTPIYKVKHSPTKSDIYISPEDIKR